MLSLKQLSKTPLHIKIFIAKIQSSSVITHYHVVIGFREHGINLGPPI